MRGKDWSDPPPLPLPGGSVNIPCPTLQPPRGETEDCRLGSTRGSAKLGPDPGLTEMLSFPPPSLQPGASLAVLCCYLRWSWYPGRRGCPKATCLFGMRTLLPTCLKTWTSTRTARSPKRRWVRSSVLIISIPILSVQQKPPCTMASSKNVVHAHLPSVPVRVHWVPGPCRLSQHSCGPFPLPLPWSCSGPQHWLLSSRSSLAGLPLGFLAKATHGYSGKTLTPTLPLALHTPSSPPSSRLKLLRAKDASCRGRTRRKP